MRQDTLLNQQYILLQKAEYKESAIQHLKESINAHKQGLVELSKSRNTFERMYTNLYSSLYKQLEGSQKILDTLIESIPLSNRVQDD